MNISAYATKEKDGSYAVTVRVDQDSPVKLGGFVDAEAAQEAAAKLIENVSTKVDEILADGGYE